MAELDMIANELDDISNVDELSPAAIIQATLAGLYKRERRLQQVIDEFRSRGLPDRVATAERLLERVVEQVARMLELSVNTSGGQQQQQQNGAWMAAQAAAGVTQQLRAGAQAVAPQAQQQAASIILEGPPEIPPDEICWDELKDKLGSGAFADVYRATCRGKLVAVKVPHNQDLSERQLKSFRHEVTINKKIFHPNVVLFLGACTKPRRLFIVMELMTTDLERLIHSPRWAQFNTLARIRMAHEAALGMNWLHGICQIVHRDVKPANFLLDESLRVKVTDFGFSEVLRGGTHARDRNGAKGTALYMAPEVLQIEDFDQSADVYSFGLIVWEMLTGREPYSQCTDLDSLYQTVCIDCERPQIPEDTPKRVAEMLEKSWRPKPEERGGFPQIVNALEDAIIDTTISDAGAREFWRRHFGHPLRDNVPWDQFEIAVAEDVCCSPMNVQRLAGLVGTPVSTALLGDDASRCVTAERFGMFALWFGPFYQKPHGLQLIREMAALLDRKWFHSDIQQPEAESRLRDRPSLTFLLRLSYRDPTNAPFTLSKNHGTKITHQRVKRIETDPTAAVRYEVELASDRNQPPEKIQVATLEQLVDNLKSRGAVASACPSEPLRTGNY